MELPVYINTFLILQKTTVSQNGYVIWHPLLSEYVELHLLASPMNGMFKMY